MAEQEQALEPQLGTVAFFQQHFFVSTPTLDWPSHIESEGYLETLNEALLRVDATQRQGLKLTAFHAPQPDGRIQILCFPSRLQYRIDPAQIPAWAEAFFSGERCDPAFQPSLTLDRWIFVCAHASRDQRCGDCAPGIIEAAQAFLTRRGAPSTLHVAATSHVGGHKFAGNLLIYPDGDWYGSVRASDVAGLLEAHLDRGKIPWEFWRGRAGLTLAEQTALGEGKG